MRKRIYITLCMAAVIFSGCAGTQTDSLLEFPGIQWDMTMDEVLDACKINLEEAENYDVQKRVSSFYVKDYEIFGETASTVEFSFVNLELGEAQNLQEFDSEEMNGQERLVNIWVEYPKDIDRDKVLKEMEKIYGKYALTEIKEFPIFNPLMGNDEMPVAGITYRESEKIKVWGSGTIGQFIDQEEEAEFKKQWPIYLAYLDERDWESFSTEGRMVTAVYSENQAGQDNIVIQFDAYNLAVYSEIKENFLSGQ